MATNTKTSCNVLKDEEIQVSTRLRVVVILWKLNLEWFTLNEQDLVTKLKRDVRERNSQLRALQSEVQTIRDEIQER